LKFIRNLFSKKNVADTSSSQEEPLQKSLSEYADYTAWADENVYNESETRTLLREHYGLPPIEQLVKDGYDYIETMSKQQHRFVKKKK
jgi:hypothetical protein